MKKWPSGVPVFRDGPADDFDLLVGVGVSRGKIIAQYIGCVRLSGIDLLVLGQTTYRGGSANGLQWLIPLNADARAMLAIAKQGRR